MASLFSFLTPPNPNLFFSRKDAADPRLGDVTRHDPDDYAAANIVLLGCPQDEGVRRNGGRVGAAAAPDAIRTALYKLVAPAGLKLFDLGNTRQYAKLEETHAVQQHIIQQAIADGKIIISLGGGNDIAYPDCAGLADNRLNVLAFNFDAHFDVRENFTRNSGTPYRQLLEEGRLNPKCFYEIGYQPFAVSQAHSEYLRELGVGLFSLKTLRANGLSPTLERILRETDYNALFWGVDMDVVHINEAPGVSAPNPLGMSGYELCELTSLAGANRHTRLLEFTEVNPTYDIDQRTARLVAVAIFHFLTAHLAQNEAT